MSYRNHDLAAQCLRGLRSIGEQKMVSWAEAPQLLGLVASSSGQRFRPAPSSAKEALDDLERAGYLRTRVSKPEDLSAGRQGRMKRYGISGADLRPVLPEGWLYDFEATRGKTTKVTYQPKIWRGLQLVRTDIWGNAGGGTTGLWLDVSTPVAPELISFELFRHYVDQLFGFNCLSPDKSQEAKAAHWLESMQVHAGSAREGLRVYRIELESGRSQYGIAASLAGAKVLAEHAAKATYWKDNELGIRGLASRRAG